MRTVSEQQVNMGRGQKDENQARELSPGPFVCLLTSNHLKQHLHP